MALRHQILIGFSAIAFAVACSVSAQAQSARQAPIEPYIQEALPPHIQVVGTEVDGPLFAEKSSGRTLYIWPERRQNDQGIAGEREGRPTCGHEVRTVTAGFHEPYPPGLELPELDTRPSCADLWPPLYAEADAKPVGKWSVVERLDGRKQWAYGGQPVYMSALDRELGDVIGTGVQRAAGDSGAHRKPIGPLPDVPAQFAVATIPRGRLLTTIEGFSVYTWDNDEPNKSNCGEACQQTWEPMLAGVSAPQSRGDWGVIERSPGVWQWTYRQKPLYALIGDEQRAGFHGSDIPGWNNVFTMKAPAFPASFRVQDAPGGQVLADAQGRTIYIYSCMDDSLDQMGCEHPTHTQVYRMAMCGAFDKDRCLANFPYVLADANARSESRIWAVKYIDPNTGRYAHEGDEGALRVWTYRDRPVYTFAHDKGPGDTYGDSWGENNGWINGYHAFFVREEFRKQYLDTGSGR